MRKTSSIFRVSSFHNRLFAWIMLTVLGVSFLPSVSHAQPPTATIKMLSGDVLVSGQAATVGTVLQAGETIQAEVGASVVLKLSDGSEVHLGEKTEITFTELSQTATRARVSYLKLHAGRVRAFLSSEHQQEGSVFTIETPNARIDATFSEPDIEVSYSLEKAETVGIAHTVDLMARSLVTDEETLVPVGSSVIITAVGIKVITGIVGVVGASSASSTEAGTASAGSASGGASGISTGTIAAIGATAAAAGGVAAVVATTKNEEACTTAECTGIFLEYGILAVIVSRRGVQKIFHARGMRHWVRQFIVGPRYAMLVLWGEQWKLLSQRTCFQETLCQILDTHTPLMAL